MKNLILSAAGAALLLGACTTTDPYTGEQKTSNTAKGAAIGAVVGAVAGAVIGEDDSDGALAGGAAGAAVGAAIGNYMDRQEAELRRELASSGVQVQRIGNDIELIMPSNITFDSDQAAIQASFYDTLNDVSQVLAKYDDTRILVEGHTDSTGSDEYNMALSIRRAESVGNYLAAQGVSVPRIEALGYGERSPIADNVTETGKQQNRRVEIRIKPTGA